MIEALRAGWTLDGAIGTELVARGADPEDPERWVLERPAPIESLHRAMLDAGAYAITSASFAAPRSGRDGERRVRAAVALARAVEPPLVLAALGPGTGHAPLAEVAAEAGADAVVLETFVDLDELVDIAASVVDRLGGTVPVIAGYCPLDGELGAALTRLPRRLRDVGVAALLVGCGDGRGSVATIAQHLAAGPLPVVARPSAGLPGAIRAPRLLGAMARNLRAAGVVAMGACCGGGAEHIRAIARAREP